MTTNQHTLMQGGIVNGKRLPRGEREEIAAVHNDIWQTVFQCLDAMPSMDPYYSGRVAQVAADMAVRPLFAEYVVDAD